jgi:translation elongation factor EF-Tu-like GTPase
MWPFRRKRPEDADDMSVDTLLAQANKASPPSVVFSDGLGSFRMPVEDTFVITGRGLVATGRVESGTLSTGMEVRVVRDGHVVATTTVNGIEQFRKVTDTATTGENIGVLLKGLEGGVVSRGDVLTA